MVCFQVHPKDNVGTMLEDGSPGPVSIRGEAAGYVTAREAVLLGHKIALSLIASGSPIVKFGVQIGKASRDIEAGDWVHLHNCESTYDARSQTLDLHSGAATDTTYE